MRKIMRAAAMAPAALLAIVLGVTGAVTAPAPAAHALTGYRVCGVYNSSTRDDLYGTGLVARIYKEDHNNETCSKKIDFMRRYYAAAYPGSSAQFTIVMVDCETFGARIGADPRADICHRMQSNLIYKYTSKFDKEHPADKGDISFWHN